MPSGRPVELDRRRGSSGARRHEIVLEQRTNTRAPSGAPVEAWTTLARVYASRSDVTAGEEFGGGQESAFLETHWIFPYRADCDPELVDVPASRRVNDRGRIYDIKGAAVIAFRESIAVMTLAKADV